MDNNNNAYLIGFLGMPNEINALMMYVLDICDLLNKYYYSGNDGNSMSNKMPAGISGCSINISFLISTTSKLSMTLLLSGNL